MKSGEAPVAPPCCTLFFLGRIIGIPCCFQTLPATLVRETVVERSRKRCPFAMASFTPRTSRNAPLLPGDLGWGKLTCCSTVSVEFFLPVEGIFLVSLKVSLAYPGVWGCIWPPPRIPVVNECFFCWGIPY